MGITCKPVKELRGNLRKIDNENLKEQKILNHQKSKSKEKTS